MVRRTLALVTFATLVLARAGRRRGRGAEGRLAADQRRAVDQRRRPRHVARRHGQERRAARRPRRRPPPRPPRPRRHLGRPQGERPAPRSQKDKLRGGRGHDWIYASHGWNVIHGGPGHDTIRVWFGRGFVDCGPGDDDILYVSKTQNKKVKRRELRARDAQERQGRRERPQRVVRLAVAAAASRCETFRIAVRRGSGLRWRYTSREDHEHKVAHALDRHLDGRRAGRGRGLGRDRAGPRRADLRRLADRAPRSARTRSPTASTPASSPARCSASTTSGPRPAERLDNGMDYQPTDRRVLFGHHFAAIAGAGPLVGPVLAAQMGYLPGTIWIIVGVIFAGAVQDMVILFFSMRRDGKSLGQMARDEIGPVGGVAALIAVFSIMIILLAVLALVVVNALAAVAVGHVLARDDHPDRPLHGLLPARAAARAACWRRPRSASRCCCWRSSPAAASQDSSLADAVHAVARDAGVLPDRLRLRRLGAAGVDAAGAARLPVDLHEDRHHRPAGGRHPRDAAGDAERGGHGVRLAAARARCSPARCSRSCSSPSPAAPCRASTR